MLVEGSGAEPFGFAVLESCVGGVGDEGVDGALEVEDEDLDVGEVGVHEVEVVVHDVGLGGARCDVVCHVGGVAVVGAGREEDQGADEESELVCIFH